MSSATSRTEPARRSRGARDPLAGTVGRVETDVVIRSLARRVEDTVRDLVDPDEPVALVDFPNHANVGDSAIWLGEIAALRALGVRTIAYTCDTASYRRADLAARLGSGGTILIHGGGNFGDLWPRHQRFREQLVAEFPAHRIVQLPQSAHFRSPDALQQARSALARHPQFTVLTRDQESHALLGGELGLRSIECPDAAFCMGPIARRVAAVRDVLWLARTDIEAVPDLATRSEGGTPAGDVERVDWVVEPDTLPHRANTWVLRQLDNRPNGLRALQSLHLPLFDRLAAARVDFGMRLLARGRAVVTDRLHGHILSTLLGIPHVLLDNSYGKVSRYHDRWTASVPLCRRADSPDDAVERALALARAADGRA